MADDNRVTYEMLYELVRREKSREELQKLDETYLSGLLMFLREQDARMMTTGKSDLFALSERDQLMVQSQNTRRLVRELYERRERKILDLALNRSRTGSDLIDTSNLIAEERALFDMLVTSLDAYRRGILGNLLMLKEPETALLGYAPARPQAMTEISAEQLAQLPDDNGPGSSRKASDPAAPMPTLGAAPVAAFASAPGMRRVRFTQPVDQFVGQELELYGPFQPGEEAELPDTVAEVLLAQQTATDAK